MDLYYAIVLFVFGITLGSFYNVVGYRLPNGQSIVKPSSHCPNCNHKLKVYELIPILSFLFLGRKCSNCKQKISWFYAIFEFTTGILFVISYFVFGISFELLLAVTFISILLIIIISDYFYMIIPDEVLIFGLITISIEILLINNFNFGILFNSYLSGIICFLLMYALKLFGDFAFKKESMGGGDIKLMFLIGMVLNWKIGIVTIFLSAFIALPVAIFILLLKKEHILPYGPFLSIAAILLFLSKFNIEWLVNLF